ncbi:urease accessory protein UreE [Aliterella atlantica]|uniref:Urease accessory protein UreE n=1 Tax=Aliterella atlantica CENA595 TaxID=1618023 RepID=A0A0D8ZXP9_9CYAN|nr:urease accessory protein UreE [Aliterella atlantica]KJH73545.1 urease accessory protein UreE [Aliterella atlantica CENA595]
MLTLTQRLPANPAVEVSYTLALTATERDRSRHRFETIEGQVVFLRLSRGTVLQDGDLLKSDDATEAIVRVLAKPEPVIVVKAATPIKLLQAAYHLGNRHVPVEIGSDYLCLSPDPVLEKMLANLGVEVVEAVLPFQPQPGAYSHEH